MISQLMTQLSITTGQSNDHTTGFLLNFAYFEKKNTD